MRYLTKERKRSLSSINRRFEETQYLYKKYSTIDELDDYSLPIYNASVNCEILVTELLKIQGIEVRDHRVVIRNDDGSEDGKWIITFLADKEVSMLPEEYREFFRIIYHFRKEINDGLPISCNEMIGFIHVYECFLVWFFSNNKAQTIFACNQNDINDLISIFENMIKDIDGFSSDANIATIDARKLFSNDVAFAAGGLAAGLLPGLVFPLGIIPLLTSAGLSLVLHNINKDRVKDDLLKARLDTLRDARNPKAEIKLLQECTDVSTEQQQVGSLSDSEKIDESIRKIVVEEIAGLKEVILDESKWIKNKLDDISSVLSSLMKQINQYQMLVQNQIDIAVSDEEIDRIVHVYSEACVDKIVSEIDKKYSEKARIEEESKLISALGGAWDKLSEESKNYLVSAKVTYGYYSNVNTLDYSGVCLLVTKALELEMSRRFYSDFTAFLKQGYEDSWKNHLDEFPTTLIKVIDGHKRLKSAKDFTLGAVSFVLCYNKDNRDDEAHQHNNEIQLIRFARNGLMDSSLTDQEIMDKLKFYGEAIDDITKRYRNKAAHTNQLKKVDADECFELVIDVEKLLKKILDSFLY